MESRAGSLSLVGGVLAFDFVNTAGGRDTPEPIDHLQEPTHLVDWAAHAGCIDAETARRSYRTIAKEAGYAQDMLRRSHRLRDTVYCVGSAIAGRKAAPPADLQALKEFARRSMAAGELARRATGGYVLDFSAAPADVAVLGPVAWSALALLATADFTRIKQCPGPDCGWLFLDHSKNNSRLWCDMATCGNRAKARKHRERHA